MSTVSSSDQFVLRSYSQLGEDRILCHLFKNMDGPGFYIDAGAYHPYKYSNTALLYSMGWRGINIDLSPYTIDLFKSIRPEDISLNYAISNSDHDITCYFFGDKHSTVNTADVNRAKDWSKRSNMDFIAKTIPAIKLQSVIDNYCPGKKIDFLNIDVEGYEMEALLSINFQKNKPHVIAVEIPRKTFENIVKSEVYLYLHNLGYKCISYSILTAIFVLNSAG